MAFAPDLNTILHHISQGILFVGLNGIVTTCNESAEKILGLSAKELLSQQLTACVSDDIFGFSLEEALKSKVAPRLTYPSWSRDGIKVELEVESTFVSRQGQSEVQGMLIVMRDITQMRQLQKQAHRNSRLRELGEMAAHLAHEIRNPLGGIRGFASLLCQDLKDRTDLQKMAGQIIVGTDDLNGIVTSILDYARPFEAHFVAGDLIQYIQELKQFMQADACWDQKIDFVISTPFKELTVFFDPVLMRSALMNLFVNSCQAMPEGGVLTVSIGQEQESVVLRIQDTGKGIAPEHIDKLFSPFFTTKARGSGLGLSEVHKVIQAHQGWIEVHSELNKGTLFVIKLPRGVS